MKHWPSTVLQWVSIITSPLPREFSNTAVCNCAGIVTWRATWHELNLSLEASSCECVFTMNNVLSSFTELIIVFFETVTTGSELQGSTIRSVGISSYSSVDKQSSKLYVFAKVFDYSKTRRVRVERPCRWKMAHCPLCSLLRDLQFAVVAISLTWWIPSKPAIGGPSWLNWGQGTYQVNSTLLVKHSKILPRRS